MKLKKSTLKTLAGLSQCKCSRDGYGMQILLFSDGSIHEAISSNDELARGDGNRGWESPILRISRPMKMSEIEAELE